MGKMAVPIGVVAIVLMLVVPLPAALIDMLLAINITASLLILLVAMQIKKPLDFAVFPSLLLVATLFRLSLNVSSTRLVLTDGYAGKVIDAIAGIVVTLVNLIGGFAIGVMQRGMEPGEAVSTFSVLSVGDGLVSMIPALLMSTATGIIVTRSATEGDMGTDLLAQLGRFKQPVRIAGGAAIALCLIPGLPKLPFLVIGAAFLVMASRMSEAPDEDADAA